MASSSSEPPPPVPVTVHSHRSVPVPVSDSVPGSIPLHSNTPPHLSYKNRLQGFALKSKIKLPMYQTVNEGGIHAPKFRSTLWVGETSYTTQSLFFQRKAAEQEVARIALESLLEQSRDEGRTLVDEVG